MGHATVTALHAVDLEIERGCVTVVAGPSGCGKSTLLHMVGLLDRPDEGHVMVDGHDPAALSDDRLSRFRGQHIGFVFQSFNLIPVLSALENVEYPMRLGSLSRAGRLERARQMLAAVGLADKAGHRPNELSGGQRQRVAIARALANRPPIVIADEPTANLDRQSGAGIIALLRQMQAETGCSILLSSHDPSVIEMADIRIDLLDGRVVGIGNTHHAARGPRMDVGQEATT
ncbi:MAG: ABC transporter ATP-binding protein [Lautropia sp.]|nr:ABC transporter ATP-binding protein [Lautropia sp.]